MIYCSRCGNSYPDSDYEAHLVRCVLRSRVFRRTSFRPRAARTVATGKRPRVRRPDFTSPEAPTVAPVTQADRIDAGLRSRRIRTVHVLLESTSNKEGSGNWLKRAWQALKGDK